MLRHVAIVVVSVATFFSSTCLAQEKQPDADEVLRKCAETYKAMKSLYENGRIIAFSDGKRDPTNDCAYALAIKRPILSGPDRRVLEEAYAGTSASGNFTIAEGPNKRSTPEKSFAGAKDGLDVIHGEPFVNIKTARDPVEYQSKNVHPVGSVTQCDLDGRGVYRIEVKVQFFSNEHHETWYIDRTSFQLVGMDDQSLSSVGTHTNIRIDSAVVDKIPTDAKGRAVSPAEFIKRAAGQSAAKAPAGDTAAARHEDKGHVVSPKAPVRTTAGKSGGKTLAEEPAADARHVSKTYSYSIDLSLDWDASSIKFPGEADSWNFAAKGPVAQKGVKVGSATYRYPAVLQVEVHSRGVSGVDDYLKKHVLSASSILKDYRVEQQSNATVAGVQARVVVVSWTDTTGVQKKKISNVVVRGNYGYEVSCEAMAGEFDRVRPLYDKTLASFKFLSNAGNGQ